MLGFSKHQAGFTLIELLVSIGILAGVGTAVLYALDTNSGASRVYDEQVIGANLATSYLEAIRQLPYDNNSPDEYAAAGNNIDVPPQYLVVIDADYSSDGYTWSSNYSNPSQTLQKITVLVTRTDGGTVFRMCTFRTEF